MPSGGSTASLRVASFRKFMLRRPAGIGCAVTIAIKQCCDASRDLSPSLINIKVVPGRGDEDLQTLSGRKIGWPHVDTIGVK